MVRIEIFTNRSVEENLLDAFKKEGVAKAYSKIPVVHGTGNSGPRMGDSIWPEENVSFTIWCEAGEVEGIKRAVEAVKHEFPGEGIKLFGADEAEAAAGIPPAPGGTETTAVARGFLANIIHGITGGERRKTERRGSTAEAPDYTGPERREGGERRTQLDRRSSLGLLKAAEVLAAAGDEPLAKMPH